MADIIQNNNPALPSQPTPRSTTPAATKKPDGPVVEKRKVVAAQKAGMIVDARFYGVKPTDFAKYINFEVRGASAQFGGIIYKKRMESYQIKTAENTRQIASEMTNLAGSFGAFSKTFVGVSMETQEILKSLSTGQKASTYEAKKSADSLILIQKQEEEDYRRKIQREREQQQNSDEGIATLTTVISKSTEETEKHKKFKGSLIGFIQNPLKFIWDVIGIIPYGKLIASLLGAGLAGGGVMKLFGPTIKSLFELFVPQGVKNMFTDITTLLKEIGRNPLDFFVSRITSTLGYFITMFKESFIDPAIYSIKRMGAEVSYAFKHFSWRKGFRTEGFAGSEEERALGAAPEKGKYTAKRIMGDLRSLLLSGQAGEPTEYTQATLPNILLGGKAGPQALSGLTEKTRMGLTGLAEFYKSKTGKDLPVNYGFRTEAQQQALRDEAIKKYGKDAGKYVAMGRSTHQEGTGLDIPSDVVSMLLHQKIDGKSALEHFGFGLPYLDKKGVAKEKWHVEQLGSRLFKKSRGASRAFGTSPTGGVNPVQGYTAPNYVLLPESFYKGQQDLILAVRETGRANVQATTKNTPPAPTFNMISNAGH